MRAACTYCSALKDRSPGYLPAIDRYQSARVQKVATIAARDGLPFFILSGRLGFINSNELIPYYDHLLESEDVPKLVGVVAEQIRKWKIRELLFYTTPIERERQLQPYADLLQEACSKTGTRLSLELLEDT